MPWAPDALLSRVADYIADTPVLESYRQVAADAWAEQQEPTTPDLDPDAAIFRHLGFTVEIRDVTPLHDTHTGTLHRAVLTVYATTAVRPMGDRAEQESYRQALMAARHLWYRLAAADREIPDITVHPYTESGGRYGVLPLLAEWHMVAATVAVTFSDAMEV